MIVAVSWDAGSETRVDEEMEGFCNAELLTPPPRLQAIGRKKGRIDTGTRESARKWGRERLLLWGIPRQGLEFAPVPDYPVQTVGSQPISLPPSW